MDDGRLGCELRAGASGGRSLEGRPWWVRKNRRFQSSKSVGRPKVLGWGVGATGVFFYGTEPDFQLPCGSIFAQIRAL